MSAPFSPSPILIFWGLILVLFWGIKNHTSPFLDEYIHNRNVLFPAETSELTLASGKSVTLRSNHHCHFLVVSGWRPCAWSSEWKCRIWHEGAMPWFRICGKLAKPFPEVGLGKASPSLGPSSSAYEDWPVYAKIATSATSSRVCCMQYTLWGPKWLRWLVHLHQSAHSLPVLASALSLCLSFLPSVTALSQSPRAKLCYLLTTESRNAVILKVGRKRCRDDSLS